MTVVKAPGHQAKPTHRARPRASGEWRTAFLAQLAVNANVKDACKLAGVHRATVYDARDRDAAFRAEWDKAMADAVDNLRRWAWERAEALDTDILKFLLKAHDPMYRERHELTGAGGAPVTIRVVYDEPKEAGT